MFKLEKLNVVKIVDSEYKRDKLIGKGFTEITDSIHKAIVLEGEGEIVNLSELNVSELKTLAKERGLEGYSNMKREELLEILEGGE